MHNTAQILWDEVQRGFLQPPHDTSCSEDKFILKKAIPDSKKIIENMISRLGIRAFE